MDMIPTVNSIKQIERQYDTGELPVLVVCSDKKSYICKYMRSSTAAYKLVSEFVGSQMVKQWGISSPFMSLVKIKSFHWTERVLTPRNLSAPSIGYVKLEGVVDITPTTCNLVLQTEGLLEQLLKISLFDFWVANEDRTYNNANLLYDIRHSKLVSIDYGGIFNTSTFECPLSQLTLTDSILYADLFRHLSQHMHHSKILEYVGTLRLYYDECIEKCRLEIPKVMDNIPQEWNVSNQLINNKLNQLVASEWIEGVWNNFIECLKDALENE